MKRFVTLLVVLALVVPVLAIPATAAPSAKSFLVIAKGNSLPANLSKELAAAGGTLTGTVPEIGLAVATSTSDAFKSKAARIKGVQAVVPNLTVQHIDPAPAIAYDAVGNPPNSGSADFYFDLQWGHTAIGAPAAWEAGYRGAGVRVAVLDDGIDPAHPDLAPNLNVALSTSFVPDEPFTYVPNDEDDVFSHGAHVAGTIAAAENNFGTIGVAPEAELVMVKVLSSATGSGSFEGVAQGIVYAANIDADIINMSLGAEMYRGGFCDEEGTCYTAKEVTEIANLLARATTYAYQQGTTVIASSGNEAVNSNQSRNWFHLPSDAPHVISVAATGPMGWALDPETDLNVPAVYSNHGLSTIDFAAPGGNIDEELAATGQLCTVAGSTIPCYGFDFVFSTGYQGWYWSAGTSMAAPHASGVAALIIGANGGDMHPAHVEAALRSYALDLGKPGKDAYYGHGLIYAGNLTE